MKRLTIEEYAALPHGERTLLRRAAFGHPGVSLRMIGNDVDIDLNHLKELLSNQNAQTGVFPERWVDTKED
jgi:hypothetical protein